MLRREIVPAAGLDWQVLRGGAGRPVVWLHGLTGADGNDPFLDALSRRVELFAPVMPGFADLDELDGLDDIHDLALAYDEMLAALNRPDALVVGHGFGGMVAAEIAAHVPRRVTRLGLIAPMGLWDEERPVADLFALPGALLGDALWEDAAARTAWDDAHLVPDTQPAAGDAMIATAQANTAVAKFVWPIPDKGLRKRLRRIVCPTLLLWGAADRVVPATYADLFARRLTGAVQTIVAGAGHMLPYERTAITVDALAGFAE